MHKKSSSEREVSIRPLDEEDAKAVHKIDLVSSNSVAEWLDCEEYAWGIFLGDKLIGYCSVGGADDFDVIKSHPFYTDDSKLLSDVYILAEYRHQGYGLMLVKEVVEQAADGEAIFLSLLYDNLSKFYEKADFEWAFGKEYIMVRKASEIA